jgi:signal transduction histidine kinase
MESRANTDTTNERNTKDAIYFNFSYAALKLLGKNLYSNAANAISELVANGIDAKAKNIYVYIDMSDKSDSVIEIVDDGLGMDYDDLARKYVWIGRNKRNDPEASDESRQNAMGRKGIGKLAALYLSNDYYIFTKQSDGTEEEQWEINLSVYDDSEYPRLDRVHKRVVLVNQNIWGNISHGTAILLHHVDLRKNGTKRIEALKRVFADFYLVDELSACIYVGVKSDKKQSNVRFERVEKSVAFENFYAMFDNTDRKVSNYMRKSIAFTWASKYPEIAKQQRETKLLNKKEFAYKGRQYFKNEHGELIEKDYELKGWIGIHATIEKKNAVDDRFIRNDVYQPNRLRIYVRNKLAVSDFFEIYQSTQAMANFIEGDVSFDILDDNDLPDIATSSRQDFLDDERVDLLISILDSITKMLFRVRIEIGQKIRGENTQYEEEQEAREAEERAKAEEERAKAEKARRRAEAERERTERERAQEEKRRKEAEQKKEEAEERQKKAEERAHYIMRVSGVENKSVLNMIHSIYNMSNRVKENLNALNGVVSDAPGGRKSLEKAVVSNQRILSMSKLVTKAGIVVDKNDAKQPINMNSFLGEYVSDVLTHIYDKEDIDIIFQPDERSEYVVRLKPLTFIIIIDNIVGNAIKARAKELRIIVTKTQDEWCMVKFVDNGCGIDPSITDRESLFEFGVTTTNGSGLGLFYARKYLNDINGTIEIADNEGAGVSVTIKIKLQKR